MQIAISAARQMHVLHGAARFLHRRYAPNVPVLFVACQQLVSRHAPAPRVCLGGEQAHRDERAHMVLEPLLRPRPELGGTSKRCLVQSRDVTVGWRCKRHSDVLTVFSNHSWQAVLSDGGVAQVVHELVSPGREEAAQRHKLLDERVRRAQDRGQVTCRHAPERGCVKAERRHGSDVTVQERAESGVVRQRRYDTDTCIMFSP